MLAPYWSSQETDEMGPASKLNTVPKYVVSSTKGEAQWNNTRRIIKEDVEKQTRELKEEPGGDSLIMGSGELIQSLMKRSLVDEYVLLIHPVVPWAGRRLLSDGSAPATLQLAGSKTTAKGVVIAAYRPAEPPSG